MCLPTLSRRRLNVDRRHSPELAASEKQGPGGGEPKQGPGPARGGKRTADDRPMLMFCACASLPAPARARVRRGGRGKEAPARDACSVQPPRPTRAVSSDSGLAGGGPSGGFFPSYSTPSKRARDLIRPARLHMSPSSNSPIPEPGSAASPHGAHSLTPSAGGRGRPPHDAAPS
ncbi:hypothetical protein CDD83_2329 [Cordyceps sp. RAO-2017]|nr:hypothetical protein CDD83_2329 [Cordyceps sp. RAO-2017]